jgi:hypothetical protein
LLAGVRTAPNFGEQFWELWIETGETVLRFEKGSTRGFQQYIFLGFEDILFFYNNPIFKIEIIPEKAEIIFNVRKIPRRLQKF